MKTSETIGALVAALAKAKAQVDKIKESKTVERKTKDGKFAGKYTYATFDDVLSAVTPALLANEIVIIQGVNDAGHLATRLAHSSGEWIESSTPIFNGTQPGAQGFGSGMTYARRYATLAILGVSPEEDDDGKSADGPRHSRAPARQPRNGSMSERAAAQAPMPEPDDLRDQAITYAKGLAERVKAADRTKLLEIEHSENGSLLQLNQNFPDIYEHVQQGIAKRWKALDLHQAPPNGKANGPDIAGSKFVNGDAHG